MSLIQLFKLIANFCQYIEFYMGNNYKWVRSGMTLVTKWHEFQLCLPNADCCSFRTEHN